MFDISLSEIGFVLIIALLIFKPEDWPEIIRSISKVIYKIKSVYSDITNEFKKTIHELDEQGDIKSQITDLNGELQNTYDISDLEQYYKLDNSDNDINIDNENNEDTNEKNNEDNKE